MARLLWTRKQNVGPRTRFLHAMAFDARRLHSVLFGGLSPPAPVTSPLGDTWTWDGESWTQVDDIGPPARADAALVYDSVRDRTVLFGGPAGVAPFGDTWEWNDSRARCFRPTLPFHCGSDSKAIRPSSGKAPSFKSRQAL